MAIPFGKLRFGYASAQEEGAYEPRLLLEGFLDPDNVIDEVRNGRKFLVLGYKGAGKSAITEHFKLLAANDPNLFVRSVVLSDFLYSAFKQLDDSEHPTAWSWLILFDLFSSLATDAGAESARDPEFVDALGRLAELGVLDVPTLEHIGAESSRTKAQVKLPIFEIKIEQIAAQGKPALPNLVNRLRLIASTFRSASQHIVFVDGLDEILTKQLIKYELIAALLTEVTRLNTMFAGAGAPIKIVLLCRTDLFERLPGANKNKLRQDSAINMSWFRELEPTATSRLVRLINRKAQVSDPLLDDVFGAHFPATVHGRDIRKHLLDFTRHTPRDILQLMKAVQDRAGGSQHVLEQHVYGGVKTYSIEYFIPEIKDELAGFFSVQEIEAAIQLIGALRHARFGFAHLEACAVNRKWPSKIDLPKVVSALFDCSAIGNIITNPNGTQYYIFRYRNPHATVSFESTLVLHRAVRAALNFDFADANGNPVGGSPPGRVKKNQSGVQRQNSPPNKVENR